MRPVSHGVLGRCLETNAHRVGEAVGRASRKVRIDIRARIIGTHPSTRTPHPEPSPPLRTSQRITT
ncbi:uncharacterized protein FOMMEDRAFT_17737 [Fomitiporia mediterranea MF3/22]|uniref:uncharacterized protein n=1 Tax=Fomitiporia mediterranea (strain MF3/22) TaxID=694068 RepID=UPI0004407CD9|nr:uncharacterized protein FOMMEDRAFT_17737 [Fomitiporia mediterranea MF3/22]EJD05431.1 hypothetical protein FOMMEDRAFT_17737 [Fomitiporia mediterranea MF3/22]